MARRREEPEFDFDQDIVDIIPERFDRDADSREAGRGHRRNLLMTLGLGTAAIIGVGAVGLYFFSGGSGSGVQGGGVPMIRADQGPLKTRPDDRGGMEVPNQDKLVYERMGAVAADPRVERLLPPPEAPQMPPSATASAPETPPPSASQPPVRPQQAAPTAPAQADSGSRARNEPPPPASVPQGQVAATPVGPVATAPKPPPAQPTVSQTAAKPTASPPKPGDFVVQLAALKSHADAEKTWALLAKRNTDLLGSLATDIVRVDLGQKGVFFRLRAGPMDEPSAKDLCGQLAQRKVGCLVARK